MAAVNVLLSSPTWIGPRNEYGLRHHVALLYEHVFQGEEIRFFPQDSADNVLLAGLRYAPIVLHGDVSVLAPGYPVVSGVVASLLQKNLRLIVHTWKVPGFSDPRLSAHGYDLMLRRVIERASAVVVANHMQRRQIEALGVSCPVIFAPVTVDGSFWHPEPENMEAELTKLGLERDGYVLTVGGNDRDERYGAEAARALGILYVRASNDLARISGVRAELERSGLTSISKVLAQPSDTELRSLYAGAHVVCLPTLTHTNPAGLSALVEAMACGALTAIPESLAEGYIKDTENGFLLPTDPNAFARKLSRAAPQIDQIRQRARETALSDLAVAKVAANVRCSMLELSNVRQR